MAVTSHAAPLMGALAVLVMATMASFSPAFAEASDGFSGRSDEAF